MKWNLVQWVRRPIQQGMKGSWPLTGVEDGCQRCSVKEWQMKTTDRKQLPTLRRKELRRRITSQHFSDPASWCVWVCVRSHFKDPISMPTCRASVFLKASFKFNFKLIPLMSCHKIFFLSKPTHHSVNVIYPVFAHVHIWYIWLMLMRASPAKAEEDKYTSELSKRDSLSCQSRDEDSCCLWACFVLN